MRFEELERRLLFSGDITMLAPTAEAEQGAVVRAFESYVEPLVIYTRFPGSGESAESADTNEPRSSAANDPMPAGTVGVAGQDDGQPTSLRHELVIVDATVPDYRTLLDDLLENTPPGIEREVRVLDPMRDGLAQITEVLLQAETPIDGLHLITHATSDGLYVGGTWLDDDNLDGHAAELADWRRALSAEADILFYGCNLAQTDAGQQLLQRLSRWTDADVAASADLTGHGSLGGDWTLEYHLGTVETEIAIGALAQRAWVGTLLVNQVTTDAQTLSSVAADAAGNFVVVWQSNLQDGSGSGVYGRRYDAAGTALGGEFLVATTTAGDQHAPDVAVDSAGNYVIVWTGEGQDGDGSGEGNIYARLYDAAGNEVTGEFRINATTLGNQGTPAVAYETESDTFMVTWASESQDSSGWGVYARKFDATGAALIAEFRVNSSTAGDQLAPDVAGDSSGNFEFVWQSDGQDGDGWGIYRQYYRKNDTFKGIEARVNVTTAGDQTDPAVQFNSNTDYLIVWVSAGQDGSGTGIYGNYIKDNSQAGIGGGEFRANATTLFDQLAPSVSHDGDRNFVVAWTGFGQDLDGAAASNIYAQLFERSGGSVVAFGGEYRINVDQAGSQQGSAVAMSNGGDYVLTWDGSSAGDADGIEYRQFANPFGNQSPTVTMSNLGITYVENAAPLAIDAALILADADSVTFAGATIQFLSSFTASQDTLAFTNQLGISGSYDAATGVLTLAGTATITQYQTALRTVTYQNTSDAPSSDVRRIAISITDGSNSGGDALDVTIQAVNDAPVLSGGNDLVGIAEDVVGGAGTLVSALISGQVNDADGGTAAGIAVIAADNTNGTWQYTLNGGGLWSNFGAPTGSSARLLYADANTSVRFVPNANWSGTVVGGIGFRAWDGTSGTAGATADTSVNGGTSAFSSATAGAGITVTAVNDAPSGADKTVVTNEDTAYTFVAADFGLTDVNDTPANGLDAVRIVTLPGAGSLRLNGVAVSAGQFIAAADINAGRLTYLAALNASGAGYATFTFEVRDDGGTDAGGIDLDPSPDTITVDVTAINDAPVNVLPGPQVTAFLTPLVLSAGGGNLISIADIDAAAGNVEVTLSATDGLISLGSLLGIVLTLGDGLTDGTITFSGTVAQVNAALDGLIFIPNVAFSGIATLTVTVDDLGNTGAGGPRGDTGVLMITVNPVTTVIVGADARVATEDAVLIAPSVLANDIDLLLGTLSVTAINGNVAAIGGAFVLSSGATLTMNADGTFSYDPNGMFAALAQGASATDSFIYTVDSTSGGTASGTVTITINGANDAPVLSGANGLQGTAEDAVGDAGTLVSALISGQVIDADGGAATGMAVIAVDNTNGTWQYTTNGGGLWNNFGVPTGASARLLSADADTAVRFVPNANWSGTVAAGISFRAWDGTSGAAGGTADTTVNGGTSAFSLAAASASITVSAVNDAPSGADKTLTTNEDTAYVFVAADFGLSDANDTPANGLDAVRIATLPGAGSLTLNGVAVSAGQFIAVADITAGRLAYLAASNASGAGYAAFTFEVRDDGGTDAGGVDLDPSPNTITVDVNAVNDAPAGSSLTVTTPEDTDHVFSAADFGFADVNDTPENVLAAVRISTLATAGTLTLNAVAVTAGQSVTVADLVAGLLVFTPGAHANGPAYATFTFQVQDDGGTAGGGIDLDATPNVITVAVTAVNDAPNLTGFAATIDTVPEDIEVEITFAELSAQGDEADVDGSVSAFVVRSVASGTLRIGTSAAAASAWIAGVNDTIDATRHAYWTASGNAQGTLNAFDVVARDNAGAESISVVTATVFVTPVADTPTVIPATTDEDTQSTAGLVISRHAADGVEVTHFRITAISGGTLYQNDGSTPIADGDFITVAQGNAGLRFTPLPDSIVAGYFMVTASTAPAVGGLGGATVTANIAINPIDDAPVAVQVIAAPSVPDPTIGSVSILPAVSQATTGNNDATPTAPVAAPSGPTDTATQAPTPDRPLGSAPPVFPAAVVLHASRSSPAIASAVDGASAADAASSPVQESVAATVVAGADPGVAPIGEVPAPRVAQAGAIAAFPSSPAPGVDRAAPSDTLLAQEHDPGTAVAVAEWRKELDRVREQVQGDALVEKRIAGATAAVTGTLSAGYVLWLVRGGVLLTSVLSSLPAWRVVDPLLVLARRDQRDDDEDEESLESIVEDAAAETDASTEVAQTASRPQVNKLDERHGAQTRSS